MIWLDDRDTGQWKFSGKSKGGLSKGGLGPKGAKWPKRALSGQFLLFPRGCGVAEELVPIGPEKAPIGPEKVPICPEKARFRRKDFPPIFSENLGPKPPFVSPPLDFPKIQMNGGSSAPYLARTPCVPLLSGPVLRDTARLSQRYPPIAHYGVFGVSTWPTGCDTPSPSSEHFPPWRACEVEVRYPPPPTKGLSQRYLRDTTWKQGNRHAIPPSAILSRKGIAWYGGISHWAAKFPCFVLCLIGVETEGLLDYQGRAGIISIVRWNLRPVIFGVDQ